ncbi:hypothetical protein PoB_005014300 [Plakobranchus ocellatus]|uniref:Uncharacterized protein n=1 Tax=Plakobranchus ocellatus TaxID=259542 RepID=A0AAV4BXV6_9GAST|nr:hypothetical protein PoB_005014300 [Plakobranchus ocellatus]
MGTTTCGVRASRPADGRTGGRGSVLFSCTILLRVETWEMSRKGRRQFKLLYVPKRCSSLSASERKLHQCCSCVRSLSTPTHPPLPPTTLLIGNDCLCRRNLTAMASHSERHKIHSREAPFELTLVIA